MNGDNTEAMPGIEFAESRGRVSIPPETRFKKSTTPSSFNFCAMVRFSASDKPVSPLSFCVIVIRMPSKKPEPTASLIAVYTILPNRIRLIKEPPYESVLRLVSGDQNCSIK